jgi:hypothetical protein
VEILHKDYVVDEVERETLVASTYDVAQDFVSSYDFTSLAEPEDNNSPKDL